MDYTPKQLALIEKHRDINTDHDWWDSIYEEFVSDMHGLGIEVTAEDIQFSGFCSQGDGASFTGMIYDWNSFLAAEIDTTSHPMAVILIKLWPEDISATITRGSGHGCHAGYMGLDMDWDGNGVMELDDPNLDLDTKSAVAIVAYQALFPLEKGGRWREAGPLACEFEEAVLRACRDKADDLHSKLEDEYEHLTSDDVVWETLEANGIEPEEEDEESDQLDLIDIAA